MNRLIWNQETAYTVQCTVYSHQKTPWNVSAFRLGTAKQKAEFMIRDRYLASRGETETKGGQTLKDREWDQSNESANKWESSGREPKVFSAGLRKTMSDREGTRSECGLIRNCEWKVCVESERKNVAEEMRWRDNERVEQALGPGESGSRRLAGVDGIERSEQRRRQDDRSRHLSGREAGNRKTETEVGWFGQDSTGGICANRQTERARQSLSDTEEQAGHEPIEAWKAVVKVLRLAVSRTLCCGFLAFELTNRRRRRQSLEMIDGRFVAVTSNQRCEIDKMCEN